MLIPSLPVDGHEQILRDVLDAPIRVEPLTPRWVTLSPEQRGPLEQAGARLALGRSCGVGRRMPDVGGQLTVVDGPVPFARLEAFLPGGEAPLRMVAAAKVYLQQPVVLRGDVQVPTAELPRLWIGGPGRSRLRQTMTVGKRRGRGLGGGAESAEPCWKVKDSRQSGRLAENEDTTLQD